MSNKSKTLGGEMKAEREAAVVKEKAEQELLALQEKLRAANEKMELLQTRKTPVRLGHPAVQSKLRHMRLGFPAVHEVVNKVTLLRRNRES